MPSYKYNIAVEHKSMAVRMVGWCAVWHGVGLFVSLQVMNAAHRTGKSANDVNVYVITIRISHLN